MTLMNKLSTDQQPGNAYMANKTCTGYHVKLVHVGDLWPVPERLPADAAVGERTCHRR